MLDVIYQVNPVGAPATGLNIELHAVSDGTIYPYAEMGQGNYKNDDMPVGSYDVFVGGVYNNQRWQVGSGVTTADRNTLNTLTVEDPTETHPQGLLKSDLPIQTTLNSLALGDKIILESAGDRLATHDEIQHLSHFYTRTSVPTSEAQGATLEVARSVHFGGKFWNDELSGAVSTNTLPASGVVTQPLPLAFVQFEFVPAEDLVGDYQLTIASDAEEDYIAIKKFRTNPDTSKGEVPDVVAGTTVAWSNDSVISYPANATTTTTIINLENGELIQLYATDIDPTEVWRRIQFRQIFEQQNAGVWGYPRGGSVVCNGDKIINAIDGAEYFPITGCTTFDLFNPRHVNCIVAGVLVGAGYSTLHLVGGFWVVLNIAPTKTRAWVVANYDSTNLLIQYTNEGEWQIKDLHLPLTTATKLNNPTHLDPVVAWADRLTLNYGAI